MIIDYKKSYNEIGMVLTVFVFSDDPYVISSSVGTVSNNKILMPIGTKSVEFTVNFPHSGENIIRTVQLTSSEKTLNFSMQYSIGKRKEHIYKMGNIKKYFQSWSTAGQTDFSSVARVLTPLLLDNFDLELYSLIVLIKESELNYFPLPSDTEVLKSEIVDETEESMSNIFFSHLYDFSVEETANQRLVVGYSNGGKDTIGNNGRSEKVSGSVNHTYETKLKYGNNNDIDKVSRNFINNQVYDNFIFRDSTPINVTSDNNILKISSENKSLEFYSPKKIEQVAVTPFGDVFILSDDAHIYYSKLEVDIPSIVDINPSINNNNIVEISQDYFTPTDDIEIIISLAEIRNLGGKKAKIIISNQNNSYYLSGNDILTPVETSIAIGDLSTSVKTILETDEADRFMMVKVYVDNEDMPYIAYCSGLLLSPLKINDNLYDDLYVANNKIVAVKNDTNYTVSAKYHGYIKSGEEYVSFKI